MHVWYAEFLLLPLRQTSAYDTSRVKNDVILLTVDAIPFFTRVTQKKKIVKHATY